MICFIYFQIIFCEFQILFENHCQFNFKMTKTSSVETGGARSDKFAIEMLIIYCINYCTKKKKNNSLIIRLICLSFYTFQVIYFTRRYKSMFWT